MSDREVKTGFRDPEDNFPSLSYMFRISSDIAQEAQAKNVLSSTWMDQRLARLDRGIPIGYAGAKDYSYDEETESEPEKSSGEWTETIKHHWDPHYNYAFWGEPIPAYKAEYPYNEVYRSESGHVFETDDTPGHERLNKQHRTGTYEEIDENGSRSQKIIGSNYEIVCGDEFVYIKGKTSVTVDGSHHLLVLGDCYREVTGNETTLIRGDKIERIGGNYRQEINGSVDTTIKESKKERVRDNVIEENLGFRYHWTQGNAFYANDGERTDIVSNAWNQHTTGTLTIGSEDTMRHYTNADMLTSVKGNQSIGVEGNIDIGTESDMHLSSEGNMTHGANGEFVAGADGNTKIGSQMILNLSGAAGAQLQADANVDIDGAMVFMNTNMPGTDIVVDVAVETDFDPVITETVETELARTVIPESEKDRPFTHSVPEKPDAKPQRPGFTWTKTGLFDYIKKLF